MGGCPGAAWESDMQLGAGEGVDVRACGCCPELVAARKAASRASRSAVSRASQALSSARAWGVREHETGSCEFERLEV